MKRARGWWLGFGIFAAFLVAGLVHISRVTLDRAEQNPFPAAESEHRENLPDGIDAKSLVVPVMRSVYVAASDGEAARVYGALEKEAQAVRPRGVVPASIARAAEAPPYDRAIVGLRNEVIDRISTYRERLDMNLLVARPQMAAASPSQREASLERLAELVADDVSRPLRPS